MPTIKDIALKAGVSVATVSYVINNTRWVHEDKRRRVLEAIEELNYVPNAVARGLRVQKSDAISFIVSDITNPFYTDLAKVCEDIAQQRGYTVNIVNTDDRKKKMLDAISQIRGGKVDGAIVTSALEHDREAIESLIAGKYPIVLASRRLEGLQVDSVVADNKKGAIMATNYLIGLGHKKIAFVNGVEHSYINESRTSGYLQAMHEADLQVYEEWLTSGEARYEASYRVTRMLLELPAWKRPTAILNLTDIGALGVIDAAQEMKVRVPEDLAVVGFDDLFISGIQSIRLTTVKIPRQQMGSIAISLLFDRMENENKECQEVVLPVELIVRKTCGGGSGGMTESGSSESGTL